MIEIKTAILQAITQLKAHSDCFATLAMTGLTPPMTELTPAMTTRLEAEILLAHTLMNTRAYLYTHAETRLTKTQWQTFQQLINQRAAGLPIAYLTGRREFWSLPFKVSADTLIPRPETELLVELTLAMLTAKPHARLLDLGTGSGAIALACASERPDWQITACDCSESALQIAQENAAEFGITNVNFCHSDWFTEIATQQSFDAIVSNPPYIAANDPHLNVGDLRFEPPLALVGGDDGLAAIQHIIHHGLARLEPGGLLLIEHGFDQKTSVRSMLNRYGYIDVQCWQDWQGNDRVSGGRRI